MSDSDLLIEQRGAVTRLMINRPERLNSLRMGETDRAILDALKSLETDGQTKVVLLAGNGGKAFCTGWDMEEIADTALEDLEALIRTNLELFFGVWMSKLPVVAAVDGYAVGTGSALALACDLTLASDTTKLGEPEVRHGALSPFLILPFLTHSKAVHEIY